jgi:hypothetical protein
MTVVRGKRDGAGHGDWQPQGGHLTHSLRRVCEFKDGLDLDGPSPGV